MGGFFAVVDLECLISFGDQIGFGNDTVSVVVNDSLAAMLKLLMDCFFDLKQFVGRQRR